MKVLGIDPGSHITGYGIISFTGSKLVHVDNGGIHLKSTDPLSKRLKQIHQGIAEVISTYKPNVVALEKIFVAKNARSAMTLGHARGVIMLAAVSADLELKEYAATEVKQALTGYGRASKEQIQQMTKMLLGLKEVAHQDASDALAVAICHCQSFKVKACMEKNRLKT